MQEIEIKKSDEGQRFDKFLKRYFSQASSGFLYKMLRKKNITLNKQKADGSEVLRAGDKVYTFFSDETYNKFIGNAGDSICINDSHSIYDKAYKSLKGIKVIYETDDLIFLSKPAGVLAQTDASSDISVNEWLVGYLEQSGFELDLNRYKPSSCNRLDRNTSGLVMAAKTYAGSRFLTECIRSHNLRKYYAAICEGRLSGKSELEGYLLKDEKSNKVKILREKTDKAEYIHTLYKSVSEFKNHTLLEVQLITGKSHQIRAHLASIGHPLAGDIKYGGHPIKNYKYQLLHAKRLEFPEFEEDLFGMSGKIIECPLPAYFMELT